MRFEFATASRIIFGRGTRKEVAPLASEMGNRALIVTGRNVERIGFLSEALKRIGVKTYVFSVPIEPTIELTIEGLQVGRKNTCDIVIGMGGGSAIDMAKAIAVLLTNTDDIMDYLEVIGRGKKLIHPPMPCIALPTTAGTGAEVTKNSVLTSTKHRLKVSLRSPLMLPDLAVVDPELTYSLPPSLTASTGLDALTQILESFVSVKSNPLTDAICINGLKRAARSLHRAFEDGNNAEAREDMALAGLFGGLALANSKLGAVHGFAAPMEAMFPAPHGVICARLLPWVMEANVKALEHRGAQKRLLRFDETAKILTANPDAKAKDGVAWIHRLCSKLNIPHLSEFGITKDQVPALIGRAKNASSMKGNPVVLTDEELTGILRNAVQT